MIEINKIQENINNDLIKKFGSSPILFDIETTGFSARSSDLYLIGIMYFDSSNAYIKQWFVEKPEDELIVLNNFNNFIKNHNTIISYNGDGFDIPYLKEKARLYNINLNLDNLKSIDIYRYVKKCKSLLKLANIKQKSIEEFLKIYRNDIYSGKDLINVYKDYLNTSNKEFLDLLLLHNYEDVTGLFDILPIMNYINISQGNFTFKNIEIENSGNTPYIIISFTLPNTLSHRVSIGNSHVYLSAYDSTLKLKINLYNTELKYFYENYKDYYYLPEEDMAIHKSVAQYVDKEFRTLCKASNCYSKKTGTFLVSFNEKRFPVFKTDYSSKTNYIELCDAFINNPSILTDYTKSVIQTLL